MPHPIITFLAAVVLLTVGCNSFAVLRPSEDQGLDKQAKLIRLQKGMAREQVERQFDATTYFDWGTPSGCSRVTYPAVNLLVVYGAGGRVLYWESVMPQNCDR